MPPVVGTAEPALTPPPVRIARLALFLDLDGVLAPFEATPDAVGPDPRRTEVLRKLDEKLAGRLAIISGRTIDEIDRISGGAARAASGVHGLEQRHHDQIVHSAPTDPGVATAVQAFQEFASERPGVIVEDKGVSAGLHFRQAVDQALPAGRLARDLAEATGLALQPGDMVLELKTPGSDKGKALTRFMQVAPFAGGTPVMLGDDLTDEHAFQAAGALGGFGVLVGPERVTAARYRLAGTEAVMDWLEAVAEAQS